MNTRGATDEFTRTPNLPGRFGKGGGQDAFSKTDRNFNKGIMSGGF